MYMYDGYQWPTLDAACADLGLSAAEVQSFADSHRIPQEQLLALYIAQNRIIVRGLIFDNIGAACKSLGVPLSRALPYLNAGYGIDLACHMVRAGVPVNFFTLEYSDE